MNSILRAKLFRLSRSGVLLLALLVLLGCDVFFSSRSKITENNMYALPELCTMGEYLSYCEASTVSVTSAKNMFIKRGAFAESAAVDLIGVFQDVGFGDHNGIGVVPDDPDLFGSVFHINLKLGLHIGGGIPAGGIVVAGLDSPGNRLGSQCHTPACRGGRRHAVEHNGRGTLLRGTTGTKHGKHRRRNQIFGKHIFHDKVLSFCLSSWSWHGRDFRSGGEPLWSRNGRDADEEHCGSDPQGRLQQKR